MVLNLYKFPNKGSCYRFSLSLSDIIPQQLRILEMLEQEASSWYKETRGRYLKNTF